MFFVISGFVIPWSMKAGGYTLKNFFVFFLKRLIRLEPPYVVSVLLALLIIFMRTEYLAREAAPISLSWSQVGLHFFYLIPFFETYDWLNNVYWTLAIEFQYYLFMALFYAVITGGSLILRFGFYALCLLSVFLGNSEFLPYWLPVFLLGIVLFLYKASYISRKEYLVVSTLIFVFSFFRYPIGALFYSVVPLVVVLNWQNVKLKVLSDLGKFSYSIYLIHPLLGASLINVLSHEYRAPYEKPLVIALGMAVTIMASWMIYKIIEAPSKRLSSFIKYKNHVG